MMHGHACVGTRNCYLEVYMAEYKTVIIKDQMKGSSKSKYYLHIKRQEIAISKEQSLQGCKTQVHIVCYEGMIQGYVCG